MPPKIKIKKDAIIAIATEIALEKGIEQISVRHIADKLKCSTTPIYINFSNVNELILEVSKSIESIFVGFMEVGYCNIPVMNMGLGALVFANQYKKLYIDMAFKGFYEDDEDMLVNLLRQDLLFQGLNESDLYTILKKLILVTNGLCIDLISCGSSKDIHEIIDLLFELGEDIINATRIKRGLKANSKFFDDNMIGSIVSQYFLKEVVHED